MSLKIKWKFFWSFFLLCSLSLIIAGILISRQAEKQFLKQVEQNLISESKLLETQFQTIPIQEENLSVIDSLTDVLGEKINARITIIDIKGKVLGDSYKSGPELEQVENHLQRPEVQQALKSNLGKNVRFSQTVKMKMFYVAIPLQKESQTVGFVRLALPLEQLAKQEENITRIVTISILIALIFSLVLAVLLAGKLTSPLKKMTESAKEMSKGNFKIKVKTKSKDEVADLAEYFNLMSQELESKMNQLENEKIQLSSILSNMQEGVLALNSQGKILLANSAFRKMFELDENVINSYYYEVFRYPQLRELIASVIQQKEAQSQELNLGFPEEKILLTQALPIPSENENEIATILVFFDITQLKKLERIRKDFVANVSHELRTPLTSIKGFVEALQDGVINNSKQAQNFLNIISQHSQRMNRIISDLLLLSQIESEGYQLKKQSFSLKDLISEMIEQHISLAEKKQQELKLNFDLEQDQIEADREKISQVLINLLDNAIKFTPEKGEIEIAVAKNQNLVEISVRDSGIGIPSTDLPRIFERFYRVDKARSQELGGTGLGLSIVKHIVEAHNGRVWVESELNHGSTFHFTFPV